MKEEMDAEITDDAHQSNDDESNGDHAHEHGENNSSVDTHESSAISTDVQCTTAATTTNDEADANDGAGEIRMLICTICRSTTFPKDQETKMKQHMKRCKNAKYCKWRSEGCPKKKFLYLTKLPAHEAKCAFNPINADKIIKPNAYQHHHGKYECKYCKKVWIGEHVGYYNHIRLDYKYCPKRPKDTTSDV